MVLNGKTILLGVCGGIAAYKSVALCSKLVQSGAQVHVIMTKNAAQFVTPLTFQTISRHRVGIDTFDEYDPTVVTHIDLADRADLVVVAPATANLIGKYANGIADDMLSTTLLAVTSQVLLAPAMNVHMYAHSAVRDNMELLQRRGVLFAEPGEGQLACGYVGKGRLAEPEELFAAIVRILNPQQPLLGKRVLVTAGGTVERIDPVRYITNDSSGKMGFAIAEAAKQFGAEVTLISGKTTVDAPSGVYRIYAETAEQMYDAVLSRFEHADIVIQTAAVADYRPERTFAHKLKKTEDPLVLRLVKTRDILQEIGQRKTTQFIVGFAAETEHVETYAMEKLRRKRCDLLAANDLSQPGVGFGLDTNILQIYDKNGLVEKLPLLSKFEAAKRLLNIAADRLPATGGGP